MTPIFCLKVLTALNPLQLNIVYFAFTTAWQKFLPFPGTVVNKASEALIARRGDPQEVEVVTPYWDVFLGYEMRAGGGGGSLVQTMV